MEFIFGGKSLLGFIAAKPLKNSQVSFPQPRVGDNRMSSGFRNLLSGLNRSPEVAAVKRSKIFPCKPFGQRLGLCQSSLSQRTVQMPLAYEFEIPLRLTMANYDHLSSLHHRTYVKRVKLKRQLKFCGYQY
jgi:hypothetical protein